MKEQTTMWRWRSAQFVCYFTWSSRFWAKVHFTDSCWEWTASLGQEGYGAFRFDGLMRLAHRMAWLLTHGALAAEQQVLHSCDNRRCVRPSHLFLGTQHDNLQDAIAKQRLTKKLSDADVREIRAQHARGVHKVLIADSFGLNPESVMHIVRRRERRYVS